MSNENETPRDAPPAAVHSLVKGLTALASECDPILKGFQDTAVRLRSLTETLANLVAPFLQAAAHQMERWDFAEHLLKRGWVPNRTTPFGVVAECGDDDAKLQASLLAFYTDNWSEVRASLESRISSLDVDDEAKAAFQEALDAHEGGLYRCVSRLLFPEFERVFRGVLSNGRAGPIPYRKFVTELTGPAANTELADFLTAGLQDMVLFQYLTEGVRNSNASGNSSAGTAPNYKPGLAVGVNDTNVRWAKQCEIPARHAVAHGLVSYSSRQSSLNAIFIADYIFSVVSRVLRKRLAAAEQDAGRSHRRPHSRNPPLSEGPERCG